VPTDQSNRSDSSAPSDSRSTPIPASKFDGPPLRRLSHWYGLWNRQIRPAKSIAVSTNEEWSWWAMKPSQSFARRRAPCAELIPPFRRDNRDHRLLRLEGAGLTGADRTITNSHPRGMTSRKSSTKRSNGPLPNAAASSMRIHDGVARIHTFTIFERTGSAHVVFIVDNSAHGR